MGDVDDSAAALVTSSQLSSLPPSPIDIHQCEPLPVGSSRIRTATPLPGSNSLIAVTESNEIIIKRTDNDSDNDTRITAPAAVRSISTARYVTVLDAGLPTHYSVVIALLEGIGLVLYSLPTLERIEGPLGEALTAATKNARLFAVNQLSLNTIDDTFRVAFSVDGRVSLLDVNVPKATVEVLSDTSVYEPIVSLAFADMTVVATTVRNHCMLRIARSANMAMAATVLRYDPNFRRRKKGGAEPGTAVMSFFGGFFGRKGAANAGNNQLAFPLPDNRWILSVDDEWVTYSSFGAKLEDMENVFKSRSAIDISEDDMNAALSVLGTSPARKGSGSPAASIASTARPLRRSNSISSMASATSVASAFTVLTLVDEAKASRSEKPAAVAAFSSPFVLCVTDKNELLAFAANGSIPGAIASTSLAEKGEDDSNPPPPEPGAAIVPCVNGLCLALVYWPSGRVVEIRLVNDLDSLIEQRIADDELRHALALVPIERVDQTINLRRELAKQARRDDWHDAAVHHMQHVVNLCVARDGFGQIDLITEAVELRGRRGTNWEADEITATLWADFLFRLRRRIMQPSAVDIDILQTLCRADVSSTRIKALFAVKHNVPMEMGEAAITAGDCALNEDDRIEALVALYSSLREHDKALVLLENSGVNRAYQRVCSFLGKIIRPEENPKLFFKHLNWSASEVGNSKEREDELMKLLKMTVDVTKKEDNISQELQEEIIENCMAIVVEHNPLLLDDLIREIAPDTVKRVKFAEDEQTDGGENKETTNNTETPGEEKDVAAEEGLPEGEKITTDLFAIGLMAGIARAEKLQNEEVFEKLRNILGNQVLHNENAAYNPDKLIVALQSGQNQNLHEELAFLLGRQGRHEAAAVELAAERSLSTEEAKRRLRTLLPASERSRVGTTLVSAYLQVNRADAAADVIRNGGGYIDIEKITTDEISMKDATLAEMRPFLMAALISGKERQKLSEIIRAMRVSEKRRIEEDVLMKRRRCVIIGDERACSICTRRINGTEVFAAYPDETVTHLACHNVALSSNRSQTSVRSARTE